MLRDECSKEAKQNVIDLIGRWIERGSIKAKIRVHDLPDDDYLLSFEWLTPSGGCPNWAEEEIEDWIDEWGYEQQLEPGYYLIKVTPSEYFDYYMVYDHTGAIPTIMLSGSRLDVSNLIRLDDAEEREKRYWKGLY